MISENRLRHSHSVKCIGNDLSRGMEGGGAGGLIHGAGYDGGALCIGEKGELLPF